MNTKLHEPNFVLVIFGLAYVISLAVMVLAGPGTSVAMVGAGVQVLIPYLVPFAWFGGVESRKKYFDPVWVKVALFIAASIYAALSVSWASSVLNQAFGVAASNFPITQAIVSIAYLPVELLGPVVTVAILILLMSASFVFLWALFGSKGWGQALKRIGALVGISVYLGFVLGSTMFLQKNKIFLAQVIAVNLDFDAVNRCENLSDLHDVRVAHVGEGNVLVFKGRTSEKLNLSRDFELMECKVASKF